MGTQAEEVDWDRLDKTKMFVYGAGMFSGVTVALYPLTVIKTKQMTLPGISGGFQGVKQTATTIMRSEGVPGFYRGFGTVIFGTIPARGVYLTTLEWTKSEAAKVVSDLGLSGPAAAGVANFAGGALASLATQSVTVPIDVISQKQMVHGDETVVARHQHVRVPLAGRGQGQGAGAGAGAGGGATGAGTAAAATASHGAGAAGASGGSGAGITGTHSPLKADAACGSSQAPGTASAGPSGQQVAVGGQPRPGTGPSPEPRVAARPSSSPLSQASAAPEAAGSRGGTAAGGGASTSGRLAPQRPHESAVRRIGSMQMVRLIIKEEGVAGLYRGFGASVATFVPSSAVWWGAYGAYQKLIWALLSSTGDGDGDSGGPGAGAGHQQGPAGPGRQHTTGAVMGVQTTSSVLAGCTSSLVTTPLDLVKTRIQVSYKHDGATPTFSQVARQILREDGPSGFLRGAVPRMLNASLWGTCMVTVYEYLKRISAKDD